MDDLHIGLLSPTAQMGGAEISLLEIARRLHGVPRVTIILPEPGPLAAAAKAAGVQAHLLPWPAALTDVGERAGGARLSFAARAAVRLPHLLQRMKRHLVELRVQLLVSNGIKAHLLGALVRAKSEVPVVWFLREGLEGRTLSRVVLRVLAGRCDGALTISRYVETEWQGVLRPGTAMRRVDEIVDLGRFRPGVAAPADLRKGQGEIWFGMVGAITPLKGQDLFLDAAARVAAKLPEARFLLVGGNWYAAERRLGYGEALQRKAQALGVADRVMFLGHRDDIPAVLSTFDVLVQPNRGPEGLGRSVLEAMACGVPVIAVDRWGPAEIVRDGETGLLIPWSDIEALADGMIRLAVDATLRRRLGDAGRRHALARPDPHAIIETFRAAVREFSMMRGKTHTAGEGWRRG
jgi:glycosyltransferase involved in cell wall biosynthesis